MAFQHMTDLLWSSPSKPLFEPSSYGHSSSLFFSNTAYDDNSHGVGDGGDGSPNFLMGISIAVATSFIQSLGLTIQRKSHVMNEAIYPKELRREACQRPLWHLGFHTYILSNVTGTIFSIGYLPVIILAPLGAVTLVFNALFAKLLLGDQFTKQSAFGTCLILLGAILIGLFGVVPEPSHSLEDLIELWKRPAFIIYFSMVEIAVVFLLVANHVVEKLLLRQAAAVAMASSNSLRYQFDPTSNAPPPSATSMASAPLKGVAYRLGKMKPSRVKTLLGISYGCVGGMLSSQALLFAKSAIELLMLTILEGKNQFNNPLSWFLVVALIAAALLQLYYLNQGLRLCDTVLLVPLSFCAYNVSCLFNGLVYYNQWGRLYWWQILFVLFGISQVLIGVLVLAWRPDVMNADDYRHDGMLDDSDEEGLLNSEGMMHPEENALLLPSHHPHYHSRHQRSTSRPTTPRHSGFFNFKGLRRGHRASGSFDYSYDAGAIPGGTGTEDPAGVHFLPRASSEYFTRPHERRRRHRDSSMDAKSLIHGFEMFDSDEDAAEVDQEELLLSMSPPSSSPTDPDQDGATSRDNVERGEQVDPDETSTTLAASVLTAEPDRISSESNDEARPTVTSGTGRVVAFAPGIKQS
ncbi:hypothetical protein BGW42_007928 [Actinomortierella wolfii]|nr:hypothetical protein BGW42_007928 [Actinomortierella wolfii]